MIHPHSPQYPMLNANNIMNRNNRNCTAMVQPKNNVATSNTHQMSAESTTGPDLSSSSRNMLPDHTNAHNVAQYNSCKNNAASMS
jgi:hypothetical protein